MQGRVADLYRRACRLAEGGNLSESKTLYESLLPRTRRARRKALILNDLGVLSLLNGDAEAASRYFENAVAVDAACAPAVQNRQHVTIKQPIATNPAAQRTRRVAVLSFLFNWPSTGGGIIHTVELCHFLNAAGYDVRLIHARYPAWGIGRNDGSCPLQGEAIEFDESEWNAPTIRARFREAVERYVPDSVIITDSWNFKPHLAAAVDGYRYFLRLQALECLCPLNNLRLLHDGERFIQCPQQQLASPSNCHQCLVERGEQSGSLHRAERALSGVGSPEYQELLVKAFADAQCVLTLNRSAEEMVRPFARDVRTVTWGMDPARFPMTDAVEGHARRDASGRKRLLFAGLVGEQIKGFDVLLSACEALWRVRQDFELVVTEESLDSALPFVKCVGWKSQADLPALYGQTDITIVPTIAQEGLSRTAVEAMGASRPVIGSRIGGLPEIVTEGFTGLLAEPADVGDLRQKIAYLLDRPELRARMGAAGRKRFEEDFLWPTVIEREYVPLLGRSQIEAESAVVEDRLALECRVGCVLAVRDRALDVLERTLQTYAYQTHQPIDKVLVDFGSQPEFCLSYRKLGQKFGWRVVRVEGANEWNLSAAYNIGVSCLDRTVDVVFKGDVDVLLGKEVLELASQHGRQSLCIFACLTTNEGDPFAVNAISHEQLAQLVSEQRLCRMDGEGIHAYPKAWFEQVGGFDWHYRQWGYEDSDLRERATWSIGVKYLTEGLVVHQWHPRSEVGTAAYRNRIYYESTKAERQVVRNEGVLVPPELVVRSIDPNAGEPVRRARSKRRITIATRALNCELRSVSQQTLTGPLAKLPRHELSGTSALGYFEQLSQIDADWVINLDEDAFVLNPRGIIGLIDQMEQEEAAACGMPDGGVVAIRQHNPVVCNACFNIFDLRRVRPAWADFAAVESMRHRSVFDTHRPEFASRTPYVFDNFEPYYGAFFSLLAADEKILYLDGREWDDGVSTVICAEDGEPFLIHAWYARLWSSDGFTRDRFQRIWSWAMSKKRIRKPRHRIARTLEELPT